MTREKQAATSLARSFHENDRASFATLSVHASVRQRANENLNINIRSLVKRTRQHTDANYQHAIAARQRDETSWLLVRVLRFLTPRMSRSDLADLYANLQMMDADDLRSFAQQFGWKP